MGICGMLQLLLFVSYDRQDTHCSMEIHLSSLKHASLYKIAFSYKQNIYAS